MPRKTKNRKDKYSVAIVGEGITEWHYFNDLKSVKRFPYSMKPSMPQNSDFRLILKKARKLINDGYDRVFCVLDLDTLKSDPSKNVKYLSEKRKIEKLPQITIIESMPCIEYWFLIHFKDFSAKIYQNYEQLKPELKSYLSDYEKSEKYFKNRKIYQTLIKDGSLSKANITAEKLRNLRTENENPLFPFSDIDKLLHQL